jgi:hypothetical protein
MNAFEYPKVCGNREGLKVAKFFELLFNTPLEKNSASQMLVCEFGKLAHQSIRLWLITGKTIT